MSHLSGTIAAGDLLTMDASDKRLMTLSWADILPAAVTIRSSVWTITVIRQNGATPLTTDYDAIAAGGRATQLRLLATTATAGDKYLVSNLVISEETPPQETERSFTVKIENL